MDIDIGLIRQDIIDEDHIKIDKNNNVFYHIPDTNIFLKNSMFTTNFWNTAIITADGYYLDDYEYESVSNYKDYALGNIKDTSFSQYLEKVAQVSPKRFMKKMEKYC